MTIQIENICPDFFAFWEQAQGRNLTEQKQLWQTLYEERHRDIFDVYYRRWGDPAGLEEALGKFAEVVPKLREIVHGIERRIEHAIAGCAQVFDILETNFDFVVMVGLFSSNGWATTFRAKPTSFLALECFTEPRYLDILITHEAAHVFHARCHPTETDFDMNWAIGEALFQEGLATVASTIVHPRATEAEYLWFGSGYAGWIAECSSRWPELCQRFLKDIAQVDKTLYTIYFGGKGAEANLPKRAGYFVGYRAVKNLSQRYSVAEMARWSPERAVAEVQQALDHLTDVRP